MCTDEEFEEVLEELDSAKQFLKETLYFMNEVPNNKYSTLNGKKDHYKLCSRIQEFLKDKQDGNIL